MQQFGDPERYAGHPSFYEEKQLETYESMQGRIELMCEVIRQQTMRGRIPILDGIVVIPRGGYLVADAVTRYLHIDGNQNMMYSADSYDDETNTSGDLIIGQVPTRELVEGKNLLITDEVCESGKTLYAVHKHLDDLGAASVRSLVIHYKPFRTETGYVPDYYCELTDKWVKYASERLEKDKKTDPYYQFLVEQGLRPAV